MPSAPPVSVSVAIVAFGAEPWLERSVRSALESEGVDAHVVLVDNGCTDGAVDRLATFEDVTVVRPGRNTGFAEGCNLAAELGHGEILTLLNPDAVLHPGALAALAAALEDPEVGIATASVRLADRPDHLNSAGGRMHFSGVAWAGAYGEPAADHAQAVDVLHASGAGMALRRSTWAALGGFDPRFFAYCEDGDLSLRCWMAGLRVRYVPEAVVEHRYEFSRNAAKMHLLERNRWIILLTTYPSRLLLLALPGIVAVEIATTATAIAQGWLRAKASAWRWIWVERRYLRTRRQRVQAAATASTSTWIGLVSEHLDPANLPPPRWAQPLDAALARYWRAVRQLA